MAINDQEEPAEYVGDLSAGYAAMVADEEHEAEALEWSEGLIGDCLPDDEEDWGDLRFTRG